MIPLDMFPLITSKPPDLQKKLLKEEKRKERKRKRQARKANRQNK